MLGWRLDIAGSSSVILHKQWYSPWNNFNTQPLKTWIYLITTVSILINSFYFLTQSTSVFNIHHYLILPSNRSTSLLSSSLTYQNHRNLYDGDCFTVFTKLFAVNSVRRFKILKQEYILVWSWRHCLWQPSFLAT